MVYTLYTLMPLSLFVSQDTVQNFNPFAEGGNSEGTGTGYAVHDLGCFSLTLL